jgi:hypothetical protein
MSVKSRRDRVDELCRRILATGDRYADALLVVEDSEGRELMRVGGRWDRLARCYVDADAAELAPRVVQLEASQDEAGAGLAAWLESSRRGVVDPKRAIVMLLGGARGSGKTWFVALAIVLIALEWPDEWQYSVNLSTGQRREIIEGVEEIGGLAVIADRSDDMRDPWLRFVTGARVAFISARNPKRLREAKLNIRAVHINEAQDQEEAVYVNAVSATRNVDGLTVIATNRPQHEGGDWVSLAATGIEAGEIVGAFYLMDPRKNRAVSRNALDKRAAAIRVVSAEAAAADTDPDAPMLLAGTTAYPGFKPLPADRGGHIGDPPAPPDVGRPLWQDVTEEITGKQFDGVGFPYICGVDFQRQPGIIGCIAKIYRSELGALILHVLETIGVRGVEPDFSQALMASGYRPAEGMDGPTILLVGDATGARQNAEHKFAQPPSFTALRSDGWKIVPPMRHWKRGTPWNPLVQNSRAQMHALFERHQILLSPKCREPSSGFPSLVEAFRRGKVTTKGKLVEKGSFQHGPDGVRYLAWWCLPRPTPPRPDASFDRESFDAVAGVKIVSS